MSNDFILRWSGLAAAIGGPLWLFPWIGWPFEVGNTAGFLIALVGMILVAFGLFGLYLRLPGNEDSRSRLAFGLSLLGIGLIMVSAIGGLLTGAPISGDDAPSGMSAILPAFLGVGVLTLIIGLAGQGFHTISSRALGVLSFTPLLVAAALLGYMITVILNESQLLIQQLNDVFIVVTVISWILFGVSLWSTQELRVDPALSVK